MRVHGGSRACPIRRSACASSCPSACCAANSGSGTTAGRVAFAGFNDAAPDFARIAPVYTLPECRGRGYATSLVARMSRELLARGKRQAVPDDRHRQPDVECDLRPHRLSRRERRLALRLRRAGRLSAMAAPRFFVPARARAGPQVGATVELHEAAAHHATRVLRLAAGDALTLFDGTGGEYAATLVRVDKRGATVRVEALPADRPRVAARGHAGAGHRGERRDGLRDPQGDGARRDVDPAARHRAQRAAAAGRARRPAPRALAAASRSPPASNAGAIACRRSPPPQAVTEWLAAWAGSGIVFAPDAERSLAALAQPRGAARAADRARRRIRRARDRARRGRGTFIAVRLGPRVLRDRDGGGGGARGAAVDVGRLAMMRVAAAAR